MLFYPIAVNARQTAAAAQSARRKLVFSGKKGTPAREDDRDSHAGRGRARLNKIHFRAPRRYFPNHFLY